MSASRPPSQGQSKRRQRIIGPRGVRTDSVPKWSKTSRRYWAADRTWRRASVPNSAKYSPYEMTRRLRAKLSRISLVACDSQALASKASPDAADASPLLAPMLAPLLGARAESLIPITDDGSMRYDVDLPERGCSSCITFPRRPSTVQKGNHGPDSESAVGAIDLAARDCFGWRIAVLRADAGSVIGAGRRAGPGGRAARELEPDGRAQEVQPGPRQGAVEEPPQLVARGRAPADRGAQDRR